MALAAPEALKMTYRFLGKTGLQVSTLSFGTWITTANTVDDETGFNCIKTAVNCGVNFLDCAEAYGTEGSAEKALGKYLKKLDKPRSELVISTKIYWDPCSKGVNSSGLSRKRVVEGLRASLDRLDLSHVDIVFAHRPDPYTPLEETVRAFNHVLDRGWAHYWGTSEWPAAAILEAKQIADRLNMVGPVVEQPEYNLMNRTLIEREFLPAYATPGGLGTTIWSPLASGILTGKYNKGIPEGSRMSFESQAWLKKKLEDSTLAKVAALEPIAQRLGISQAVLSLAWTIKNPHVSTCILGASRPEQVIENMAALEAVDRLTPEILAEIDEIMGSKPEPVSTMRRGLP